MQISLEMICQIAITIFSGTGIYFVTRKDNLKKWGYVFGLMSQPFWFYTLISNKQWGLVALACFFTFQWIKGIYNYFISSPELPPEETVEQLGEFKKNFQPMKHLHLKHVYPSYDSLRYLFDKQTELVMTYYWKDLKKLSTEEKEKRTMLLIAAIEDELSELRGQINWKWWSKRKKMVDEKELKFEIIDTFKFLLTLMLLWGMDANEFISYYTAKLEENIRRQQNGY